MRTLIIGLLATTLLGCVVYVNDRRPDPAPQYMACDEDEVRYVIYRDYYGCDPWEIAHMRHYRMYYGYDDCDLWFFLFLSRHCHLDLRIVINRYESCGRRMHVLVRDCGCDLDIFFVRVVDVDRCPAAYGRVYGYWRDRRLHTVEITNIEFRALIDLRIGVDFYGHTPEVFFARCRANEMPCRVLYREYRDCGKGGRDCTNRAVAKVERPWDMPKERRDAWKQEVKQREDQAHAKFKEEHADKVKEHRVEKDKNWREEDERGPSKTKSNEPPSEERGPSKSKSNEPPPAAEERRPSKSEPQGKSNQPPPAGPSKGKPSDKGKSSEPKQPPPEPKAEEPSEEKKPSDEEKDKDKDKGNKKKK